MISCVLLAAGLSTRFGSPKPLAQLKRATVIEHLQNTLIDSQVQEVIVVLGAHGEHIQTHLLNHKKIRIVYNKDYNLGQTSSFKVGLQHISEDSQGIMLLPTDYPLIQTKTINVLIEIFRATKPLILIPTYHGKKGHPPIYHRTLTETILKMDNACGINNLMHQNASAVKLFEVNDPGVLSTFNTPEEFKEMMWFYLQRR